MSDDELLSHYYRYKQNRYGNLVCPIYRDGISDNEQECTFNVEVEENFLNRNEFERFWNHVRSVHPLKYSDIITNFRAQLLTDSTMMKTNKVHQMTDLIGSTSAKLNKLVIEFGYMGKDVKEFLKEFQATLTALNEQVVMLAQPINPNTTVEVSSFSALM